MSDLLHSVIGGVIVGFIFIKFSNNFDFSNKQKPDAVLEIANSEVSANLNADAVIRKCNSMHTTLGISDDDIRKAVDDINSLKQVAEVDEVGISWPKIIEYSLLIGMFVAFLMWANIESNGEVIYWLSVYFPSEMQTLGFQPAASYAKRPKTALNK